MKVDKRTACTFCGKIRPRVIRTKDTSICFECVKNANEAAEAIPGGCVQCLDCKNRHTFLVKYRNATVRFSAMTSPGLGESVAAKSDHMRYTATHSTGAWDKREKPVDCTCYVCKKRIPLEWVHRLLR